MLATGGNHQFNLSDTLITTRTGGDPDRGIFLHSRPVTLTSGGVSTTLETGTIALAIDRSVINGDVLMESGAADIDLSNHSAFTGAIRELGQGQVSRLALDTSSTWNMRGDSSVHRLENDGHIVFLPPANDDFKTLRVHDYVGDGFMVINTRLGGDDSDTDLLVIDGGTTSGTTLVEVKDAGGGGGQTEKGILVVETINGALTTDGNFVLNPSTKGYRSSSGTLAAHGYDYSLLRGGNGGIEDDWYLVSKHAAPVDPDPVDPDPVDPDPVEPDPVDPNPVDPDPVDPSPAEPAPPSGPAYHNVSPESGAYIGNQLAARRLFAHQLHDRTPFVRRGDGNSRNVWARVQAGHARDLSMQDGRVDIDTRHTVFQVGGDILQHTLGEAGMLHLGWLGGYGEARTDATSTFYLPDVKLDKDVSAHGKTTGYAVGLYATILENANSNVGAYGDAWVQYGKLKNTLSSELGTVRYNAKLWTASLETGYGFQPFVSDSALNNLVITPNAQVIYSRYWADEAELQGLRMSPGSNGAWQVRMGIRLAPLEDSTNAPQTLRPFMEINWLHNNDASVRIGGNTLDTSISRSTGELKLGAEGQISRSVHVSGHVYGQAGTKDERGYGGMLNLRYLW